MQYILLLANYLLPYITFPYLTRVLEADFFGLITFLTATITYFQIITDFGYNLSATKDIAEHQTNKEYIGKVLGKVIQGKILLLFFSISIYTILVFTIPLMHQHILLSYVYFGIVVLSVYLPDFLFRGIEQTGILTYRYIISQTITTVLTFVLVQSKDDIIWVPLLRILGTIIAVLLTWIHIKKKLSLRIQFSKINEVIVYLRDSAIYFISSFATTAFGITNTFILGAFNVPQTQIAYWGVSYNLIAAIQSLYSPIISSLYPHMAARRDFKLINKIILILVPANIVATLFVFLISEPIIQIFAGHEYVDAVPIFKALLPVLIFSFPAMLIGFPLLGVIGKVKSLTITTIISGCFHIFGLFLLISFNHFNILNIAILRSFTELILLITRGYVVFKIRRSPERQRS
jgi:PST family polysaccharide transporter